MPSNDETSECVYHQIISVSKKLRLAVHVSETNAQVICCVRDRNVGWRTQMANEILA